MTASSGSSPHTGAQAVIHNATDPARRPDVLLRKRRPEGEQVSVWWMIGAFLIVTAGVVLLLGFIPGGA